MAKGRRIKSADIRFVSLCPRGMTGLRTLYKADDGDPSKGTVTLEPILKEDSDFLERGQLIAAIWVPNHQDREGDWAGPDAIESMAHSFARNGMQLDLRHDEQPLTKEQVFVAESFVIQAGDPRFANLKDYNGTTVTATGGWGAVIQIEDQDLRKQYRDGKWGGVSLQGPALVVEEDPPASARFEKMRKQLDGDSDMTSEELAEAIAAGNKTLLGGLATLFKEAGILQKADDQPAPAAKKTEIDLTDPAAVRKHLAAMELAAIDPDDPAALKKHLEKLEKASDTPDAKEPDDSPELQKAKADLAKAQLRCKHLAGASNQNADGANAGDDETEPVHLKKCFDMANAMAAHANGVPLEKKAS